MKRWPLLVAVMGEIIDVNRKETGCLHNRCDPHSTLWSRVYQGPNLLVPNLGKMSWGPRLA